VLLREVRNEWQAHSPTISLKARKQAASQGGESRGSPSNLLTAEMEPVTLWSKTTRLTMSTFGSEANSPLKGKRILVTRPKEQASEFIAALNAWGAEPVLFPTIRITPPLTWVEVDQAILALEQYDTVIFTSVNGVRFFFQRLQDKGRNQEALRHARICAIGPQTAAHIGEFHLPVHLVPHEFRAEAIVAALEKEGITGRRFLLPRAEHARDILPDEIRQRGGRIDVVTTYRTSAGEGDVEAINALFHEGLIDVVTFTSSSTVKNFVELLTQSEFPDSIKNCIVACIGPVTANTASALGIKTDIMPDKYTVAGLTEALVAYFRLGRR
jgi:uroporphyrinogen III methyltransferase / synthase